MLKEYIRDIVQWPVYLTTGNSSHKIWRLRIRLRGMMVGFIPIHKEDSFDMKIEIYHRTMRVITKSRCNNRHLSDKFPSLRFRN